MIFILVYMQKVSVPNEDGKESGASPKPLPTTGMKAAQAPNVEELGNSFC